MIKRNVIGIGLLGLSMALQAQEKLLTIEEMFWIADSNSTELQLRRLRMSEAEQGIRIAKNDRLPSVGAQVELNYIGDGVMTERDFSGGIHADMPHWGNTFVVKASQVIYAGGEISRGIERSRLEAEAAGHEYCITQQDLRFLLLGYYLDLFQLNNQRTVYERNVEQTQILVKDMKAAYRQGTALKSDITRYELQLQNIQLRLTATENEINKINYRLLTALGLDQGLQIVPDKNSLLVAEVDSLSEQDWRWASKEAPRLQLADTEIALSRNRERLIRAERLPRVHFSLTSELNGPILVEVPPLNNNFAYWFAGVSVSYSFDSLFKSHKKLKQAKIAIMRSEMAKEQVAEEVDNSIHAAYVDLNEAYIRLRTQQKSVQLAHENYGIVRQRYLNGLALITDMLDASNTQLDMELQLANYQIGILYQYYLLKKLTGTL
ncbi:TolC family protein [Phocaeicola faecicola]|uniref:TolC family protein n=1 Tax=Phocaeicola faecicola TaxID=2739389 RepID=UPI002A816BFD|nr:TolC family protein [Phocaeicola faecicola]MDY4871757.1 TolC family protein [Phocaeicola faecicola]